MKYLIILLGIRMKIAMKAPQTMNEIGLHLYEKYRALYERETWATIDRRSFNERYGIIHNGLQALACVH